MVFGWWCLSVASSIAIKCLTLVGDVDNGGRGYMRTLSADYSLSSAVSLKLLLKNLGILFKKQKTKTP